MQLNHQHSVRTCNSKQSCFFFFNINNLKRSSYSHVTFLHSIFLKFVSCLFYFALLFHIKMFPAGSFTTWWKQCFCTRIFLLNLFWVAKQCKSWRKHLALKVNCNSVFLLGKAHYWRIDQSLTLLCCSMTFTPVSIDFREIKIQHIFHVLHTNVFFFTETFPWHGIFCIIWQVIIVHVVEFSVSFGLMLPSLSTWSFSL